MRFQNTSVNCFQAGDWQQEPTADKGAIPHVMDVCVTGSKQRLQEPVRQTDRAEKPLLRELESSGEKEKNHMYEGHITAAQREDTAKNQWHMNGFIKKENGIEPEVQKK